VYIYIQSAEEKFQIKKKTRGQTKKIIEILDCTHEYKIECVWEKRRRRKM